MLADTAYGKSRIRLVQVTRHGDRHDLRDLTVAIRFEGDYDASYTDGDNSDVLPTDTMKNTVYALAARDAGRRARGVRAARWAGTSSSATRSWSACASISTEHPWGRIAIGDREHGQAFVRRGPDTRTAHVVTPIARRPSVGAGIARSRHPEVGALGVRRLPARRIHDPARDARSPARDLADRDLALSATPTSTSAPAWRAVRQTLLETFAEHDSESVQHTLYAMGQAVLDARRRRQRDPPRDAEPASSAVRSHALRPRESQRDLRRRPTSRTA